MKNKLLTVKEYAIAEGVSTAAIYNRIRRGTLHKVIKWGVTLVFSDEDKTKSVGRPKK